MRHTQLRSFHVVAKLGSFSKAAEHLNITQPTITAQIKELESQYQVKLFYRQRNNNRLTETGQKLYQQTLLIFSLEDRAKKMLQSSGRLDIGQLNLGAVSPSAVMPIIDAFQTQYPGVEIKIHTGGSEAIRNAVLNGELEVGVLAYREPNPQLVSIKLNQQPVVLTVPNDHPLAHKKTIRLKELDNVPIIHREIGSTTRTILEDAMLEQGITPKSILQVDSREGVREASIYGIGISYVGLHEFHPHPNISLVHIEDLTSQSKSYLIYAKELESLPIVQAVVDVTQTTTR
ncbi:MULTISPECIES: LysR substrate-binding domain-containing protein [Vibrio]|uniref:LysR substrate-binding domain-containing protein n=1 Tax=Vibrio TaxID=662 RepID=UPI00214BF85D|nr:MULTISPECIES: LysR substrate-binding domain-containing protein [Vibrio]